MTRNPTKKALFLLPAVSARDGPKPHENSLTQANTREKHNNYSFPDSRGFAKGALMHMIAVTFLIFNSIASIFVQNSKRQNGNEIEKGLHDCENTVFIVIVASGSSCLEIEGLAFC